MAERLSLELELLDKVGGPAKKAADALRGVENQAKKAQKALDFSSELSRTKGQLDKIKLDPKGFHDLIKAQKALRDEREKMKKSLEGGHGGFISSFKGALKEHLGLEGLGGKLAKASFWGHLGASAVVGIGEGFIEGAHEAVEIIYDGMKDAFKAIAKQQERVAGYNLTLGSTKNEHGLTAGDEAREAIEKCSPKTAFSAAQNMDMMLPLSRAGLTGKAATTAYASSLDLAAGRGKGADQGAVSEAVELFARIQQKGGITTKQLAGVGLGETNIPAFYKDLAKQLHITAKEAEKRASQPGGINPQILMNAITDAINKQQGGKAGTGAEVAGKGLSGLWNKLMQRPDEFFEKLAKSPAIPKLQDAIQGILNKLDPEGPTGKKIFAALEEGFTKITDIIANTFTAENIDGFLDALKTASGILETMLDIGKGLIDVFGGGTLIAAIGAATVGIAVLVGPIAAAGAALAAIATAAASVVHSVKEYGGLKQVGKDVIDHLTSGGDMRQHQEDIAERAFGAGDRKTKEMTKGQQAASLLAGLQMINNVTIVAAPGEDPSHTHQRAGVEIGKAAAAHAEKAVTQ